MTSQQGEYTLLHMPIDLGIHYMSVHVLHYYNMPLFLNTALEHYTKYVLLQLLHV